MKHYVCIFLIGLISGCISSEPIKPSDGQGYIQIETQPPPFCGPCHSTTMIIHESGLVLIEQGRWLGNFRWWHRTVLRRNVDQERVLALSEALAPLRPSGELDLSFSDLCDEYRTHQGRTAVKWSRETGFDALYLDSGCRMSDERYSKRYIIGLVNDMDLKISIPEWE